jgi:leucyl aminopeptidase
MMIQLVRQAAAEDQASWLVLPVFEDVEATTVVARDTALAGLLGRLVERKEVTGSLGELTALHGIPGFAAESLLLVGLGSRAKFGAGSAFAAGFAMAKRLSGKAQDHVAVLIPEADDLNPLEYLSAMVEGAVAGTRGPGLRKTEPSRHEFGVLSFVVAPDGTEDRLRELQDQLRRGEIVGQAINLARDLVNTPPSDKAPAHLAERIRGVAVEAGINVEVWEESRIREARFGGLLGVAAGSENRPSFVVLQYARAGEASPIALVGKGVTFDSGGLSLKPSASMEDMKSDMTGAAVVIAAMQAVARLGLPVNVTGYLALTENMTGGKAMKLGDVLTMRNGKTVEVLNTDAEGRLILADALSFAAESRPARILDLATLTGACIVALGPKAAGLFSNDEPFCQDVVAACTQTGERAWRLPLDDDYKEQLKSNVADLKNVGGKWGGAITAAKFLEQFVDSTPWAHLDIAGPSWSEAETATRDAGATGCFVRTLVAYLERTVIH